MQVKVIGSGGKESGCACDSWDKWEEEGNTIAVRAVPSGRVFKIPRDGDVIYVEDNDGHTVNSWRVRESKQPEFRALERTS